MRDKLRLTVGDKTTVIIIKEIKDTPPGGREITYYNAINRSSRQVTFDFDFDTCVRRSIATTPTLRPITRQ
jgi:hypothetical protein